MKTNEATLYYKGRRFRIWQNLQREWNYSYDTIGEVNTCTKDLQPALNLIYESIEDQMPKRTVPDKNKGSQKGSTYGF